MFETVQRYETGPEETSGINRGKKKREEEEEEKERKKKKKKKKKEEGTDE